MADNIQILIEKYTRGRIPPLVVDGSPESGLLNGELLKIYQKGFSGEFSIPLGILIAKEDYPSLEEKWMQGDYHLNEWTKAEWISTCKVIRSKQEGNRICEYCDRRRAIMVEEKGDVMAFLCDNGLIDFAIPVYVGTEVVAVMFTGQRKPVAGAIWDPDIISRDGIFRTSPSGIPKVDAWMESKKRLQEVEEKLGFRRGILSKLIAKDATKREIEVSPEDVKSMMQMLQHAGTQLSILATSKYKLEKSRVVAWIRSQIAHSLYPFSTEKSSIAKVWESLSPSLEYISKCFGLDYISIMICDQQNKGSVTLLCQSGLPTDSFPLVEHECIADNVLSKFLLEIGESDEGSEINLSRYEKLPILDKLRKLHAKHKTYSVLAVPISTPTLKYVAKTLVMIMGKLSENLSYDLFGEYDKEELLSIIQAVRLLSEIVMLVDHLENLIESQHVFVEDVAHDIRNPIQNIIAKAGVLIGGDLTPQNTEYEIRQLASQARRIHLLSQRVWTLEDMRHADFEPDEVSVRLYDVTMECQHLLIDFAKSKGIEISVDREIQNLPDVKLDRNLLMQTILNLMENAIKYSTKGEVRVDGKHTPNGVSISVVNRGIQIRDEDRERIFERYVRTDEARMIASSGTGIGLALVKAFADMYSGDDRIVVKCEPILGTHDYVTEFVLPIKTADIY